MTGLQAVLLLTLGCCLVVGGAGVGLLQLQRHRSLRAQLITATLTPVVAVAASVGVNVQLMFLSEHDSTVMLVALLTSLPLAAVGAWLVSRRVGRARQQLHAGLTELVADAAPPTEPTAPTAAEPRSHPPEFDEVLAELARTRRTLAESRRRERAADQARQELVSFLSHDLRTPLAGLRALAEGLEDQVITDVPRALSHLRGTVSRMSGLVDDLFALSRVSGGGEQRPPTLVSLTELVVDVSGESQPTANAHGVLLRVGVPDDDRLPVLGSADDLARALANLVSNAIRHTDVGATVNLEASRAPDGHVRVAVTDGCGGIPEQHLSRVFDTGWRGSADRSDQGAGLGLAITRGVVESHAGRIGVRNVDGGCRFDVTLPSPTAAPR